jgi:hypothetical protein
VNVTGLIRLRAAACARHDFLEVHSQWMPGSIRTLRARKHAWADRQRQFRGTWMELGKRGIIRGLFAPTNAPSCIAMNLRRYLTGERTSFIGLDQSVSTAATAAGGAL